MPRKPATIIANVPKRRIPKIRPPYERKTRGAPPHQPTKELRAAVVMFSASGADQLMVAEQVGISLNTLLRHYSRELAEAAHIANSMMVAKVFQTGMKGDMKAADMWLKNRHPGWISGSNTSLIAVQGDMIVDASDRREVHLHFDAIDARV